VYDFHGNSWAIENGGVAPDFDVEVSPADMKVGRDPQLEKAIVTAMAQITKNSSPQPRHPPFPIHPGKQRKVSRQ